MTLRSLVPVLVLTVTGSVQAADFDPRKFLSENCTRCHDSSVYTRPNHRVQSLQGLEDQVRRCDAMLQTKLFEDDLKALVEHLNQHFYHF